MHMSTYRFSCQMSSIKRSQIASLLSPILNQFFIQGFLRLQVLLACSLQQMLHGDWLIGLQGDAVDIAAGECQPGQFAVINILLRGAVGDHQSPAFGFAGEGEGDDKTQTPQKGVVHGASQIGGQNRQAAVSFHALQQEADTYIGVAVAGVLHFAALTEQGVGLVK